MKTSQFLTGVLIAVIIVVLLAATGHTTDLPPEHDEASAQEQRLLDAQLQAQQARIEATLANGQAEWQRINKAISTGRPADVSEQDWERVVTAVAIAQGFQP